MKKIYFLLLTICLFTGVNAQIINIPDTNFKTLLLTSNSGNNIAKNLAGDYFKIDTNNDSQISIQEALQVKELNFYTVALSLPQSAKIYSLDGILNFQNLQLLYCQSHNLTSLDVNNMTNLQTLHVNNNSISSVYLNGAINLANVNLNYNLLSSLDLSTNINITTIGCSENSLVELSVNNLRALQSLYCQNNQLTKLFIKNGRNEINLNFSGNPNLQYICCDESQISQLSDLIASYSYTNCNLNQYCSFTPGGTFYTCRGNIKLDLSSNGCDSSDGNFPNLKLKIENAFLNGSMITNLTGDYSVNLGAGTYTITPVLEDPSYFSISPSSVVVNFPAQTSPFTQDFCITLNDPKHDVEISIIPISAAMPGFDSYYKIIYKNKGNQIESGTINLQFDDAILDIIYLNPAFITQTLNNLNWNYTNLQPLETREIDIILNVNSPMEIPAVNGGDVLNYTATITSVATDDMPNDNIFAFNQTVVNSYDPNDKTCLEGTTISPSKVGDYVHYMIRFENNGTANAQNIVVKDVIDTNKFDINSLVPIKGSHSFVTNISAGNKVEFIFQNINLPFDDANNDGYVAFKIKTKPTLALGNTFSNTASIYFDYNFPIITNTATTTIQALSRQDFEFSNYFKLYPNPVISVLNIETKEAVNVSSISIYNTLGQLVLVVPSAQNIKTVDVSNLSSGNYFIKINSDKGTSNTKFIKQ